jgi:hypothetical protein
LSSTSSSYSFVVDTNILIGFVIGLAGAEKNPEEALRAGFARKLILFSDCNLLFPERALIEKVEKSLEKFVIWKSIIVF